MSHFKWTGDEFCLAGSMYYDRAKVPPVATHNSAYPIRNLLMDYIPKRPHGAEYRPDFTKMFMPMTFDAEPYWVMGGLDEAYLNHNYAPYTVLMLVLRDYAGDLYDMVNGTIISTRDDYDDIKYKFNSHYLRLLNFRGSGDNKMASVSEMVRLAALFYILLETCSNHEGLITDSEERFENQWCGIRKIVSINYKELQVYSTKLRNAYTSGMTWEQFFFRYINESDEDSFWFFNLPPIEAFSKINEEFSVDGLYNLLSDFTWQIHKRNSRFAILCKLTSSMQEQIINHFGFAMVDEGTYKNNLMTFYTDFYPDSEFSGNYCLIVNYKRSGGLNFHYA